MRRSHTCVHSRLSLVESWPRDEKSFDDTWEKFRSESKSECLYKWVSCVCMQSVQLDSKWFNDIGNGMYLIFFPTCILSSSAAYQWQPPTLFYLFVFFEHKIATCIQFNWIFPGNMLTHKYFTYSDSFYASIPMPEIFFIRRSLYRC